MMTWLRKRNREILIFTFGAFILSGVVFTGFQGFALSPLSPVLEVNGEKIPYKRFETLVGQRLAREEGALSPEKVDSIKASTLQELVQEAALLQEADRYGVKTTDGELAAYIQGAPAFQRDGRFDQNLYLSYVTQGMRTTPAAFEDDRRKDLRRQKLLILIATAVRVSDGEVRATLDHLSASERKKWEKEPEKLRQAVSQEQGNAVVQAWLHEVNSRLKVQSHIERWEKKNS